MSNSTTTDLESEVNNGATSSETVSSNDQITQIIDSINQSEEVNTTDETQTKSSRPTSQTAIGAKVIKKLETLGNSH